MLEAARELLRAPLAIGGGNQIMFTPGFRVPNGMASLMDLDSLSGLIRAFFDVYRTGPWSGSSYRPAGLESPSITTTRSLRSTSFAQTACFASI